LPPRAPALRAPVTAYPHQQRGGPVPERLMGEPAGDRVSRYAFDSAARTPRFCFNDTACDHRPIRVEVLPDSFETKLVEPAERRQVRGVKSSVEHVEVFRVASVGTSIIGRPRPLSRLRRAHPAHDRYTLNYGEPLMMLGDIR
jgi:hypothetical protein